ncbi:MAG: nucleoside hydrolase [candidate division KSB1 bacterium]|nr:nucleoside hydrolase [candidate division KSB1 bacterium]
MKQLFCSILVVMLVTLSTLAAEKQKVIFDCDLAGDIDDAYALALVLTSPEFEVLGIVLDHGNTPKRAQVACRMLWECGLENIPVIVGRHTPSVVGVDRELAGYSNQFYWGEGFERLKPSRQNAADFIIENLRKYPNEVILITVGPVPNMQDVLQKDPKALQLAEKVVSMFGSFYMGYGGGPVPDAEWNVRADVEAAKRFVNSGAKLVYAGLDVTTFVKLTEENRMRLLYRNSPLTNALCGLYTLWRYESYSHPDPTLFDVVAVGLVLWPELFTTRKAHVQVIDGGYTVIDESKAPNCEIALTVNKDELIRRAMERWLKQNLGRF